MLRCRIVLGKAQGLSDARWAEELKINRHTCRLWRQRFVAGGPESLWEVAEGRGRKPQPGLAQKIVEATVRSKPAGQTHGSTRTMTRAQGVDPSTVCRIWQEHGLQPHRPETFKLSRDPLFVPKLLDVVGVYLHPPRNAVVLCVDEKSQIQAQDRTQPGLPIKRGRCGTWTHDDVRNGTTTLFAALKVAASKITGHCFPRHRHGSFASVPDLISAIEAFMVSWNRDPKPFIWQAKAEDIPARIERCRRRLEQIQPGCTRPMRRKKPLELCLVTHASPAPK